MYHSFNIQTGIELTQHALPIQENIINETHVHKYIHYFSHRVFNILPLVLCK